MTELTEIFRDLYGKPKAEPQRIAPVMTTVSDAVFGTRHNCRCEGTCEAASYMARGETFRCRLTAK